MGSVPRFEVIKNQHQEIKHLGKSKQRVITFLTVTTN